MDKYDFEFLYDKRECLMMKTGTGHTYRLYYTLPLRKEFFSKDYPENITDHANSRKDFLYSSTLVAYVLIDHIWEFAFEVPLNVNDMYEGKEAPYFALGVAIYNYESALEDESSN